MKITYCYLFFLIATGHISLAQDAPDDLSSKATDPTASLMSFNFQASYAGSFYGDAPGLEDHSLQFKFQSVIPFQLFNTPNLFRMTLPYQVDGRGDEGFGTVSLLDVFLIQKDWGRMAVGPLLSLDTTGDMPDQITSGFSIGAVVPVSTKLNVGLFSQNLFGADTAVTQIQPILAYQLGGGWSVSGGDLQFTYDWKAGKWTSLPIGFQLGKVAKIGSQPVRFSINPQYNLMDRDGLNEWNCTAGVSLLLPTF